MDFRYDTYCGLFCGACFIMNVYRQKRSDCIPDKWVSSIHDKEIKCHGCKSESVFENCLKCEIRSCAKSKGLSFCFECTEYHCEKFKFIESLNLAHHNVAVKNLRDIQNSGIEVWLAKQERRWLCSNCGSPFSWFESKCYKCGKELYNIYMEENCLKEISQS